MVLRGLWYEALAMILRTIPAAGPDSTCAGPNDWRPAGWRPYSTACAPTLRVAIAGAEPDRGRLAIESRD